MEEPPFESHNDNARDLLANDRFESVSRGPKIVTPTLDIGCREDRLVGPRSPSLSRRRSQAPNW